ncbi:MAG: hypothetical protein JW862_16900 [Anaerolineales bacterium]|nr:hypothetical protein [Anaerolineales bacterium]
MSAPVELVPLNCLRCGFALPAALDEIAWVCSQCGQGQRLHPLEGLQPLEVHYAAGIVPPKKGRPYWVSTGQVSLQRETYSGLGKQTGQAESFWSQPRRFYIPAYDFQLDEFTRLGVDWLAQQPELQAGPAASFEPVTVLAEDVPAWAEFLVMALEAERKDKVKSVNFSLQLEPPQLWILP